MGGGASLGGGGVDAGAGREEEAHDGRVAPQHRRVQRRHVQEAVAGKGSESKGIGPEKRLVCQSFGLTVM